MKSLHAAILLALCFALALPAAADQNDGRLNGLFEQLQGAAGQLEATAAEAAIWHIWVETDDRAVSLLMQKGIAAMNRGDRRGALEDFDQIVQIAPDFAEGWNKRATVHYMLGQFQESLEDIERTLALEPRHFGALSGRGLVYFALDDLPRALDSFEAALAVNPHMPGVRSNAEAIRRSLKDREI